MKSIFLATIVLASPVMGQTIEMQFTESAPKDRFTLTNTGDCPITSRVRLDLAPSQGQLIFDTSATGAGVEVFQPFDVIAGAQYLKDMPKITDGDQAVTLTLTDLPKGAQIAFTIDVDDQLVAGELGQIRVTNSEIKGAILQSTTDTKTTQSFFDDTAQARLDIGSCDR